MKPDRYLRLLALAVIISAVSVPMVEGAQEADPDAWEKRHNEYQPPEKVMDAIGVREGMTVAEVGAGRGRYVVRMAARVGEKGKIYANDIDREALDYLELRCRRDSIGNVETILGKIEDPCLPAGRMDIVYLINTYHHLDRPRELMEKIAPSLAPGGILAIIEHDPEKAGEDSSHWTRKEVLLDEVKGAGFDLVRIETFLKRDNIFIFRPSARRGD